jgi:prolyl 4-hydroxylase
VIELDHSRSCIEAHDSCPVVPGRALGSFVESLHLLGMQTLFTIDEFLSPAECRDLVTHADRIGFTPASVTTSRGFQMMPEVRNNTRVISDDLECATRLWSKLADRIEPRGWRGEMFVPVGLNERLRFYKYTEAQAFRWHRDGSFCRQNGEASRLTFMIYLNDGFEGGETEFDSPEEIVVPKTGMALLFDHQLRHQGSPVTRGTKYVVRSDVMFRPAKGAELERVGDFSRWLLAHA